MSRDIQSLFVSILKNISRQPALHLSEGALKRAFSKRMLPLIGKLNVDIVQLLADYIAEAGRLTDDIIPPHLFTGKAEICLKNSKISGRYLLKVINSCSTTLVRLDVSGCFQVDDSSLQKIVSSCKNLTQLNVKNCRKLTDSSLECLSSGSNQFVVLNIGGNFNLSLAGIENFLRSYPHLEGLKEFSLSGLSVTDDIIVLVASKCTGLTSFGMGYSDISESGLLKFFTIIGGQLAKLNLSWHSSVHSTISISFLLECISMYCPKLVELDVSGMRNLNSAHLVQLIEQRIQQYQSNPSEWLPFATLHAKFISSPKSTVESTVAAVYPGIVVNC